MTTIYVDSRKRAAGSDSDFEVDLGESLHLQSNARLAVYKIRIADSFLSTDRGRYLYWVDAALGTLNWALLPEGAYTGSRLAAWISSNFATATYSETTNSLSVAYDGNRLILNDLELQQQFPDAVDYPTSPAASPTKPFSIDHMLGPSFVSGGQQVFEFVRMMAYSELSLLFVKSKTAHSASSEVIIQQMWILRKFGGFARCGHSPSACTSARVFSLLQYAGKTGPSRILCVLEV